MDAMTRIIIADDQRLFLESLCNALNTEPGLEIVATAENGEELLRKLNSYNADVLLLDLEMPKMNGLDALTKIVEKWSDVKTIILSMYANKPFIRQAYEYGAHGYLLKNTGIKELSAVIQAVMKGERHFKGEVLDILMLDSSSRNTMHISTLTKREKEILALISKEYSNPEIAQKLFLSVETVNTHRKNILQKTGVKNTAGLVRFALQHNLVA